MITLKNNKKPKLQSPSFTVDGKINDKLDDIEIFKLMNKSHFCLFLGKAGSGKSSLVISFIILKKHLKNVFITYFCFVPLILVHQLKMISGIQT